MIELILVERQGPLCIVTLNRPDRHNAFNDEMSDAFQPILAAALEDDSAAILLRANGKSFCSGRDTSVLGHRARDESDFHFVRRAQQTRLAMQDATKPIIAAVNGAAMGGGLEVALHSQTDSSLAATLTYLRLAEAAPPQRPLRRRCKSLQKLPMLVCLSAKQPIK